MTSIYTQLKLIFLYKYYTARIRLKVFSLILHVLIILDGDLNGVTVLIKGETFTEIIGKDYCNYHSAEYYRCVERNSSVMNYAIPLSKYLPDPYVTIIFQ